MRVLIVDDHAIVRAGLRQLLKEEHPDCEVGEAGNGISALKLVRDGQWDLVLLDINLPNKNGIEVLKQIRQLRSGLPVLILSMYGEDQYAIRALKAGANGYMTKESAPDKLLEAVKKVSRGGRYISASLAEEMADQLLGGGHDFPHSSLSDREMDILLKIASGKTVSEVADELALSVKTISTYRARVLKKMNMKHNAELTHYAIKQGLVR
jgi:DNA-binding NarL/FixJ family response regulator